jgi:hypothetical protein
VRSMARGIQTYLRNLPTIIMIKAKQYEEAAVENRNKEAREVLAMLNKLRDPRNLLYTLGLAQLLEVYCEASLQAQHSYRFPTQAWGVVIKMKVELESLAKEWKFKDKPLKFVDVEAPSVTKQRLINQGTFRPALELRNVQRRQSELRDMGVLKEGQRVQDLFADDGEDGERTLALAGEVSMEVPLVWRARRSAGLFSQGEEDGRSGGTRLLTSEDIGVIEKELQELAGDILMEWDRRQVQTSLEKAAYNAFSLPYDWGDDVVEVEQLGVDAVISKRHLENLKEKLETLIKELPESTREKFDPDTTMHGYASYVKYRTKAESQNLGKLEHEIYFHWFKV